MIDTRIVGDGNCAIQERIDFDRRFVFYVLKSSDVENMTDDIRNMIDDIIMIDKKAMKFNRSLYLENNHVDYAELIINIKNNHSAITSMCDIALELIKSQPIVIKPKDVIYVNGYTISNKVIDRYDYFIECYNISEFYDQLVENLERMSDNGKDMENVFSHIKRYVKKQRTNVIISNAKAEKLHKSIYDMVLLAIKH